MAPRKGGPYRHAHSAIRHRKQFLVDRGDFDIKGSSIEEAISRFGSSAAGLGQAEVESRIERYGYNEIVEKRRNPLAEFLGRYWGPMPWLLESAMVLAFLLGHSVEAYMIFALLSVNAVIGYRHERNSRKAVDSPQESACAVDAGTPGRQVDIAACPRSGARRYDIGQARRDRASGCENR